MGSLLRVLNARAGSRVAVLPSDATLASTHSAAVRGSLGKTQARFRKESVREPHGLGRGVGGLG